MIKKLTAFRLSPDAIKALAQLRDEVNKQSAIKMSRADIVEYLIRQAKSERLIKKVNNF